MDFYLNKSYLRERNNEDVIRGIFREAVEHILLNEADSRLKVVDRILNERFSNLLDLDGTVRSNEYYVNGNPNTTWRQYLLFHLRHEFGLMTNADVKYLPVVARLAYSDEVRFDITDDNGEEINLLKRIVARFKKDETLFQKVKADSSITFKQLVEKFKGEFEKEDAADTEEANKVVRSGEYEIKEVPDFETAKYYGDRSCSSSKLCYTQYESTWHDWTRNGKNCVYVCLRKGWENIPEEPTEGNPYDLYGTSMIFAFISPRGELLRSNCRWNHNNVGPYNGGVDNAFTKTTLSQTVGVPFDEVFKPNDINKPINKARLIEMIENGNDDLYDYISGHFVIPYGVKKIGNRAFYECADMTSVVIPDSVTSIGESAFLNCRELTSVSIPDSVKQIGPGAFENCYRLASITIPDSVTKISEDLFSCCKSLTSFNISDSVDFIGDGAFHCCSSLKSIDIPNSVTAIGEQVFLGCRELTSVNIPNSVTVIGYGAFSACRALASLTIPNSVKYIDKFAFHRCTSLTSITIPHSVTRIATNAFIGCGSLKTICVYTQEMYDFFTINYPDKKVFMLGKNESRERHKNLFENEGGTTTLYHSTTFDGIDSIVWDDMIMSARKGGQHGETFGVNWFGISPKQTNGKPVIIAIDVPNSLFCETDKEGCFRYMNDSHAISNDGEIDLTQFNPRIVKFGAIKDDVVENLLDRYGEDTGEIIYMMNKINKQYIEIFGDVAQLWDDGEGSVFDYIMRSVR